eukprot:SM000018S03745  [mRNA]  locus=s18:1100612:1102012:- [translate_table: standard]
MPAAGELGPAAFRRSAAHFLAAWRRQPAAEAAWEWRHAPAAEAGGYLTMTRIQPCNGAAPSARREVPAAGDELLADAQIEVAQRRLAQPVDEQELPAASTNYVTYVYDIVYSYTFRVPVLLLQAHHCSGQPCNWEEVVADLPMHSQAYIRGNRWTFLTQQVHFLVCMTSCSATHFGFWCFMCVSSAAVVDLR